MSDALLETEFRPALIRRIVAALTERFGEDPEDVQLAHEVLRAAGYAELEARIARLISRADKLEDDNRRLRDVLQKLAFKSWGDGLRSPATPPHPPRPGEGD